MGWGVSRFGIEVGPGEGGRAGPEEVGGEEGGGEGEGGEGDGV